MLLTIVCQICNRYQFQQVCYKLKFVRRFCTELFSDRDRRILGEFVKRNRKVPPVIIGSSFISDYYFDFEVNNKFPLSPKPEDNIIKQDDWPVFSYYPLTSSERRMDKFLKNQRTFINNRDKVEEKNIPSFKEISDVGCRGRFNLRGRTDQKSYQETLNLLNSAGKITKDLLLPLIFLPINCVSLNDEENFVKNFSLKWFLVLDAELEQIPVFYLSFAIFGLADINHTTDGDLVKTLGVESLLKLIYISLETYLEMSPKKLLLLLKSLNLLFALESNNEEDKEIIKRNLSVKLSSVMCRYFRAALERKIKIPEDISYEISHILFRLINLGVKKPEDLCFKDIVAICTEFFDNPRRHRSEITYFVHLEHIAYVFLKWSTDGTNIFPKGFWPKWFQLVTDNYPTLMNNNIPVHVALLKNFLLVGLQFNQLNELIKYKSFLVKNLLDLKNPEIRMMFVGEIRKILDSKPADTNVENVLNEILNALSSCVSGAKSNVK